MCLKTLEIVWGSWDCEAEDTNEVFSKLSLKSILSKEMEGALA
jgi:hypothetical protein